MTDLGRAALSLLCMAGAGVLVGSFGWQWYSQGHAPGFVTSVIRLVFAVGIYTAGLLAWSRTTWSTGKAEPQH